MHADLREYLHDTMRSALDILKQHPVVLNTPALVYKTAGPSTKSLDLEYRPGFEFIDRVDWDQFGKHVDKLFTQHHADHLPMIGSETIGWHSFEGSRTLRNMAGALWERSKDWHVAESHLDALIDEFAHFVTSPTLTLSFTAPLSNFHSDASNPIALPGGIELRRLTDEEFTNLFGGSIYSMSNQPFLGTFKPEFALVGEVSELKTNGHDNGEPSLGQFQKLTDSLDRIILAMRTFSPAPVGYSGIVITPKTFVPGSGFTTRTKHEYVPFGIYSLAANDLPRFVQHIDLMLKPLHSALDLACSRLADAASRSNPRDAILDSAIGLEAILLTDMGDDKVYRGENRYRFAMNYASLSDEKTERLKRFALAKFLYDVRSTIAHGGILSQKLGFVKNAGNIWEAKQVAIKMLREVVERFLPEGKEPSFATQNYWVRACFEGSPKDAVEGLDLTRRSAERNCPQ